MPDPLYERVRKRIPALAQRMIETFLEEIPLYRLLPREQLDGEVKRTCVDNLRTFFATLIEDREPTDDELAEPRASACRRAQERVPLSAVLTAYHVGARLGWAALAEEAKKSETDELLAAVDRLQRYVQAVTAEVATAYLHEQQAIAGAEGDAVRALVTALLSGQPADALAERVGRQLPERWVVLALELGEHPDEKGSASAIAARRKLRRVQECLDGWVGEPVLAQLHPSGGIVLLAADDRPLPDLLDRLQSAAGAPVRAGAAPADRVKHVGRAAEQAREVLRLTGPGPGLCQLRDVLLDYQLSRPSDAQDQLAALLDPLDEHPDLLLTLQAYLAHDLDRRTTAAEVHVHPNTLDYRLKRVIELTGLDPSTTKGLQLLAGAVAVRRLR